LRSVAGYVADRTGRYWLCMLAGACFAAGLMSFEPVSYHLANTKLVAEPWIPVMLGFSTGCAVIASLVLGKLYDRVGMPVVCAAVVLSSLFAPFAFHGSLTAALVAMPLWGIGYAAQDTLLKVLIAGVLPEDGVRTLLHRVPRRMADRQHCDRVDV
jgi:predicted MFS family arabinose efflux permease